MKKVIKKFTAWIMVFILSFPVVSLDKVCAQTKSENFSKNYTLTGDEARDLVAVAKAQAGKTKGQLGYTELWCADYVSDCAKLAGISRIIPFNPNCGSLRTAILNAGGKSISAPQSGDILFYYCKACARYVHVGIMTGPGVSIQGNYDGRVTDNVKPSVYQHKVSNGYHSVSSGTVVYSYVRPDYKTVVPKPDIEPFRYNLDQAPADGTVLRSASDRISFGGWALTTYGNGEGLTCINIIVNGKDTVACTRNQRDDVASAFPNYANANAGFNGSVSAELLQPGRNTVALRAYATNVNRNDILVSDFGERTIYYEPENSSIEGCIDSVKAAGKGKFSTSGWVYDRNSDQTPLPIHIYVGGEAGTPGIPCYIIQADKERRDVAEACFVGDYHGFSETLTTDRFGTQPVYFYAIDATGTKTKLIGSSTVFIEENKAPDGAFDRAISGIDKIKISGWMHDEPDSKDSIPGHIYVDGPAGSGTFIGSFIADKERKDVAELKNVGIYHGFEEEIKLGDLEGEHTFYIHAIDTDGGTSTIIGSKTVNIQKGSSPTGAIDHLKGVKGGISLGGWSADRDAASKAVTLHVYIGGHIYVIRADKERPDVDEETGLGRFHGFNDTISTTERGTQEVKVFALDEGSNQPNVLIGEGTVVIEEPDIQNEHIHEYAEEIIKPATCTEYGERQFTCACGDYFIEMIEKSAHTVVTDESRAATCEKDGITEGSHCSVCGTVITAQEIIAKTGHRNTVVRYQKEADCVCAGYTGDVFCTDCGMKIQDGSFTEQLEHTPGEDVIVIKEPTESEAGISLYTCTVCKTMGVKVTPALGAEHLKEDQSHVHEYIENVIDSAKAPAYYSKMDVEERVQACACGAYVLETVSESDIKDSQTGDTKEPDDTEHGNNVERESEEQRHNSSEVKKENQIKNPVPGKNMVFQSGSCLYRITKSAAKGGTVELKAPIKKTLKSVSIPQTVNIDGYTFQVTGIGKNAFKNNKKLKKVTIGANVTRIEANAFRGCSKLKQIIVKSERIDHMGKNAWKGIHVKASIRAPKAVKKELGY